MKTHLHQEFPGVCPGGTITMRSETPYYQEVEFLQSQTLAPYLLYHLYFEYLSPVSSRPTCLSLDKAHFGFSEQGLGLN